MSEPTIRPQGTKVRSNERKQIQYENTGRKWTTLTA